VAVGPGAEPAQADLLGRSVVHFGHLAGCYAELTAVPLDFVVPLDAATPLDTAAAVALAGTTAHVLVHQASRVRPGATVVVHAAAGSTGGALVQVAAAAGAEVIAIASTAAKAATARDLGARHTISAAGTPDLATAVLDLTGGSGATVVFDGGGGATFDASLDMLGTFGTLVLYGQTTGPVPAFDPGRLSGITGAGRGAGSLTLTWAAAGHYLAAPADRARVTRAVLAEVAAGRLSARIAGRYPLTAAADAHTALAGRGVVGKLLLAP
jgi:NADPH2:quinone reductase